MTMSPDQAGEQPPDEGPECPAPEGTTPCPRCGGELELKLGIWAKGVVIEDGRVVNCEPAESSDFADGINGGDEFAVSCMDCGEELERALEGDAPAMWTFTPPDTGDGFKLVVQEDGTVACSCGSTAFTYEESCPSTREMRTNEKGALMFWGSSDEGDGDDNPGVVCENGHEPDTGDVSIDWG